MSLDLIHNQSFEYGGKAYEARVCNAPAQLEYEITLRLDGAPLTFNAEGIWTRCVNVLVVEPGTLPEDLQTAFRIGIESAKVYLRLPHKKVQLDG